MRSTYGVLLVLLAALPLAACGDSDGESGPGGQPEVLADAELFVIPGDVAATDDAVWVAGVGDGGGLQELGPDSLREHDFLEVAGGADAVSVGGDTVWALSGESGNVTVFDASSDSDAEGTDFDIEIDSADVDDEEVFRHLDASGDVAYANGLLGLRRMTADGAVIAPPDPDADDDFGTEPDYSDLIHEELPMVVTPSAVWAVTEDGLNRFDPETLTPLDDSVGSDDIEALAADDDVVWSVTEDGVVTRHDDDRDGDEIADLEGRFPDDEVPEAIAYTNGALWLVGAGELVRLDPETGKELGDSVMLPGGTEESGYAITPGPEDGTVVVVQRPTHLVWLVG